MPQETPPASGVLGLRKVGDLVGHFVVRSYQRGYRWDEDQVSKLLDDVWQSTLANQNCCLQPIVVKRMADDRFELIDGQQRLTTLYLILHYIQVSALPNAKPPFTLEYETRPWCADYLAAIDERRKDENIDLSHLWIAFNTIQRWFDNFPAHRRQDALLEFRRALSNFVHVIWFEASAEENSITLFTRLNVGRIPLTNAELIKALLLSRDTKRPDEEWRIRQIHIATQWDNIERELHHPAYWAFLTNHPASQYPCRIEFIFDLLARKSARTQNAFDTFYAFRQLMAESSAEEGWTDVLRLCEQLREWYENRDLYHKVGYLVAVGGDLGALVDEARDCTKSDFMAILNDHIRESINASVEESCDWTYTTHDSRIRRLLVLLNVETVRQLQNTDERYPFAADKGKEWTLEHIHAQNSETLNRMGEWVLWLRAHRDALEGLPKISSGEKERLRRRIDAILPEPTGNDFHAVALEVAPVFSAPGATEDVHTIDNLALLDGRINSSLSNSAFEVKRRAVLDLDQKGEYIPICTRRVFLKYYTRADAQQIHFWGAQDRRAYLDEIGRKLAAYFKTTEQEAS